MRKFFNSIYEYVNGLIILHHKHEHTCTHMCISLSLYIYLHMHLERDGK